MHVPQIMIWATGKTSEADVKLAAVSFLAMVARYHGAFLEQPHISLISATFVDWIRLANTLTMTKPLDRQIFMPGSLSKQV